MARVRELSRDELVALEEERDFLLRSLDDLEGEHGVGDVDDQDYATLRDDYTARAARVIRTLERHQAREAEPEPSRARWRRIGVVAGVVMFAVLAGVLVADIAGRREAGDSLSGDIRETSRTQIDEADGLAAEGDYEAAIELLDEVLVKAPDNVEALTFKGWYQFLSGEAGEGLSTLVTAAQTDDTFPATHAFLAVIFDRAGQKDYALKELEKVDSLNPPAFVLQLVEPLRERLEQPASTTTTTVSASPAP